MDSVSAVSSFELLVSPQLIRDAAFLAMSKGLMLLASTGSPCPLPVVGTVPIDNPDAVGATSTMLASTSLWGLSSDVVLLDGGWNRKSVAGFSTGTAKTGVICGTIVAALEM